VEDAFDEDGFQWKPVVHSRFEIAEKTQVKALKYETRL
jgi:hypothetical protein